MIVQNAKVVYMKLYYDKDSFLEVVAPNTQSLLKFMIEIQTNKKYMKLKECANILYILNQSIVIWSDKEYEIFIGKLPQDVGCYYMTINANQKGKTTIINRNNVETLKNDFDFLLKLFSNIIPSMIMLGKKKLFMKEN